MGNFQSAYKKVMPSIVGIGLSDFQGNSHIIGTGFIIHQTGLIMSNRHVLEPLLINVNNQIGIRPDAAVILFVKANPGPDFTGVVGVIPTKVIELAYAPYGVESNERMEAKKYKNLEPVQMLSPEEPDIGVIKIEPSFLPPEANPLTAVEIISSVGYEEGTNVGIIGFPQGLSLPSLIDKILSIQLTPLLQVGVISAVLPFSGIPKPTNYIIDLFVNSGSSGSPLFLENGKVIGIVYATKRGFSPIVKIYEDGKIIEENNTGVFVPSGLGLAIPSSSFPEKWVGN